MPYIDATKNISSIGRVAKNASIYLCHKYSGAGLKKIGELFGIKESAVSQANRRFVQCMEKDIELRELVGNVIKEINI